MLKMSRSWSDLNLVKTFLLTIWWLDLKLPMCILSTSRLGCSRCIDSILFCYKEKREIRSRSFALEMMELFRWPIKKKKKKPCVLYVLHNEPLDSIAIVTRLSCLGFSVCRSILFCSLFCGLVSSCWCGAVTLHPPWKFDYLSSTTYTERES